MHVQQTQHFPRHPARLLRTVCVGMVKKPPNLLSDKARRA
ncbi:hypothetical protein BSU04_08095 [Caballeronia sordidicola]|uniref:Uncharacterized protein n=1 Tax=Caballeronia sordidicola TaxID=196367 RepID=A0A226X7M1_CABSO|nr:hypothetical protein BSU04_08095 [Caballeronia sordidicola]